MTKLPLTALVVLGALVASACVHRFPEPTPEDIPRLTQALARSPADPELLTQLGIAQFKARRFEVAEVNLLAAVETGQAPGQALLYLGLTREAREDWGGARQAYNSYLEVVSDGPLREEIDRRLFFILRQEVRAQARSALSREDELSTAPPMPGSVGVFPFRVLSDREDLLPLQVALADMMISDLALSRAVTVLERTRVQALLDEMALTEARFTDPATGARAGRLLRAEHIVQGALQALPDDNVQFGTDVLSTQLGESRGEASAQSSLNQLFDLEKEAVFQVLDILRAEITPAERAAIDGNRPANLLAFLAYGNGLLALDRGDFAGAATLFRQAVGQDPTFAPALDAQVQARALEAASPQSVNDVAQMAAATLAAPGALVTGPGVSLVGGASTATSLLDAIVNEVVPSPMVGILGIGAVPIGIADQGQIRDPTQESTGQEGVTAPTTASIRITIRRPGGGN